MELEFSGEVFTWRGPAPYYFVRVPKEEAAEIADNAALVTYGWGMIPVEVTIGDTVWATSLWPREGAYVVPLKDRIRTAEEIFEGDVVTVRLSVDLAAGPG